MVTIENLRKTYGKFTALNGMNLSIKQGEMFGFVGPNGAGKTTTIRILAGLLRADSGKVLIDGIDVRKHPKRLKKVIGYMPDFFGVYDNLKVREYMDFFASIYGLHGKEAKKICSQKLDLVNLLGREEDYVDGLSRGMKQRLCLARCLICNPKLLILDEPASGLDPRARVELKEIFRNLSQEGYTILISSHILSELSEMCTNIGIAESGRMVLSGTVEEIMSQFENSNPIVLEFVKGQEQAVAFFRSNPKIETISTYGKKVYVGFRGTKEEEAALLEQVLALGTQICSYGRAEGSLEALFMQITSNSNSSAKA